MHHIEKDVDVLCVYYIDSRPGIFNNACKITMSPKASLSAQICNYTKCQFQIASYIMRHKNIDNWIVFLGESNFTILLLLKLLNKRVSLLLAGSTITDQKLNSHQLFTVTKFNITMSYYLAHTIILYSTCLIHKWNLQKFCNKIEIAPRHYLNFKKYSVTAPLHGRPLLIGYIGRLSVEKGVLNLIRAIPAIFNRQEDSRIFIGGDGDLKDSIQASLREGGVTARVDLPGWISHDDLPRYLNQLRLLVLPSYTEGLPNIMLEAMACGTPVLATPVGAIPDVIIDGKTGFIMENNSPECIAENVIRALNSPDLEEIAEAGRRFVEEHFTFEKVVENWKKVLQNIS